MFGGTIKEFFILSHFQRANRLIQMLTVNIRVNSKNPILMKLYEIFKEKCPELASRN